VDRFLTNQRKTQSPEICARNTTLLHSAEISIRLSHMNLGQSKEFRITLETEAASYGVDPSPEALDRLVTYYELLDEWNPRLHLVAPTSARKFAARHVLESLMLLNHLPRDARVADIGSGAGLPIIPCLIARPDFQAVLIESSKKKAVFLREALNQTGTSKRASVIADRFENVEPPEVDFVTCRALERFEETIPQLVKWAPDNAVFLFFGGEGLRESMKSLEFTAQLIPNSKKRFLYVAR
jgi:16S rRNA (guanine527-N7)-methyltransferase